MSWPDGEILPGGSKVEQLQSQILQETCRKLFLTQYIVEPTRGQNILDLAFTNNDNLINHYEVTPTIVSDHSLLTIQLNHKLDLPKDENQQDNKPILSKLDFTQMNWTNLNEEFSEINWDHLFTNTNPIMKMDIFQHKLEEICSKHTELKKITSSKRNIIPKAQQIRYRKIIKLTKRIHNTSSPYQLRKVLQKLHKLENQLIEDHLSKRLDQETTAIRTLKQNPKAFYNFTKRFSKTTSTIGPFMKNGQFTSEPMEMANMLNDQYKSMFSEPDQTKSVTDGHPFFHKCPEEIDKPKIIDIEFGEEDIEKAIDKIPTTSAPGPDGIPAILLKNCKKSLSTPIYYIWRDSLDKGIVPSNLKEAEIIPIHKGGSKAYPKNYRPISLTSHITKLFERVVRKEMIDYLEKNGFMNKNQHGFRKGHSCLSQLITHYNNILNALECGNNIDTVYLDFAKAFDKVDHGILSHKLRQFGIKGKLGHWIHDFLSGRSQYVRISGSVSPKISVTSSVPQGTVLGPALFLILISDIDHGIDVTTNVSSFADDTRVSRSITNSQDVDQLQCDLEKIYIWQRENNMEFNAGKFELLRYGKDNEIKESTGYTNPQRDQITMKNNTRDLGIIMSDTATFNDHINKVHTKCTQLCGWIFRTFITRDEYTMKVLWTSFIQPQLDYCSQLWAPYKQCHIQKLEGILRSYTSRIPTISHLSYWQRLSHLKMSSIQRRIERYKIIYTWKSIENLVPSIGISTYHNQRKGRLCRIPPLNNKSPKYIQTIKENSLIITGPQLFNKTPPEVRNLTACPIEQFKTKLDNYLVGIPDEPRVPGYTQYTSKRNNSIMDYY